MDLIVNEELKSLIPPLTDDEKAMLEKSILDEGVRDALVVWAGTIVDGHNRYEIATKHGIDFETRELRFKSIEDAKVWMIDNQKGRRNLSKASWLDLGFKKAELLRPIAEANQAHGKTAPGKTLSRESDKAFLPVDTLKEAADYAGVSRDTASKYKKVIESDNEDLKLKVKSGDYSINQAYSEIKKEKKKEERNKQIEEVKHKIETEELEKPSGLFDVIVIDPPWNYGRTYDPDGSRVANPYPEMNQAELLELDPPFKDDSVLFLWTTHAFIWDAKNILDEWGFTYKATIVWDKERIGMGAWLRMQCEFCLVGIKGKPVWNNTTYRDILREPRREHSRKPDSFYEMVENITIGKKLDYFSRENRNGWFTWGAESGKLER